MNALEELDRWIAGKIKGWSSRVSGEPRGRELLEIRREILERVRAEIEPKGGGRSVFPHGSVWIRVASPDERERTAMSAALCGPDGIESDIKDLLREARCTLPPGFHVDVAVDDGASQGVNIEFRAIEAPAAVPAASVQRPAARLRVVRGQAEPQELDVKSDRVNIGRLKEVSGEKDGLRRRNDIAFAETETTVSREHATIRYDKETGRFYLQDGASQRGTSVFRDSRRLTVPKSPTRGLQLRSGDEIHLGDGRVVFETE
jgi:hypothetical protein